MAWVFDGLHLDLKSTIIFYATSYFVDVCVYKKKHTILDWIVAIGSFASVRHFACALLSRNYRRLLHAQKNSNFCPSRLPIEKRKHKMFCLSLTARYLNYMQPMHIFGFLLGSHVVYAFFLKHELNYGRQNLDTFLNCIKPLQDLCKALETDTIQDFMTKHQFDNESFGEYVAEEDKNFCKMMLKRVKCVLHKERNLQKIKIIENLQILPNDIQTRILNVYILADCSDDRLHIIQTIRSTQANF